jgi:hypothetical protein
LERCPYRGHAATSADPSLHGIRAAVPKRRTPEPGIPAEQQRPPAAPDAVAQKDLRGLAWWTAGALLSGDLPGRDAAVVSNLIRTLQSLGPEPESEEQVLAEVELRGRLMNGLPPRDEAEWALAESVFTPEAIEEFRRWEERSKAW